ncbi:MAG TPA: hypothetical protein VFG79_12065, partial [Solirubrobacter sp.]|nr:hypothetical protein [Solirubrobacter sp.]
MRRGSERHERPPRVGAAMLLKAFFGVLVIFVCTSAGVAGAGYFKFKDVVHEATSGPAPPPVDVADEDLPEVKPGGPRTLLVLGSDRRNKNSPDSKLGQEPHSDTIVLVRLDPKRNRVAVLS